MGKGGSASQAAPTNGQPHLDTGKPKQRGQLANTIPQSSDEITKRSVRESIPEHCFKRSYFLSLSHLVWDLAVVVVSAYMVLYAVDVLPSAATPFAWLFYWWYQGLTCTGLWVLAHECGHGGFTDSRLVNDTVGFFLHSSLLTPYFSWAITHAKHHHYTNHMTMCETWVPSTADPNKKSVKFAKSSLGTCQRVLSVFLVGWYMYLFVNATGARQNRGQSHFNPGAKALFKKKDANYVRASTVGMLIVAAGIGCCIRAFGFGPVWRLYFVPQMIANFYLCMITFMQHTHADVPHFNDEQWTWLRGAISTIDRSMGSFADMKTHYITSSHVAHHLFSDMPFYGAEEATPYIKAHLGKYYKAHMSEPVLGSTYLGYLKDFYTGMKGAVSIGPDPTGSDEFMWFR